MEYLLGFIGGLCIAFVIFSLIAANSMQNMITHIKNLRVVIEDRASRGSKNDADWWKDGCQEHDDEQ